LIYNKNTKSARKTPGSNKYELPPVKKILKDLVEGILTYAKFMNGNHYFYDFTNFAL